MHWLLMWTGQKCVQVIVNIPAPVDPANHRPALVHHAHHAVLKEIALLFPSEMAHLEPYEVGRNKIRRLDLSGWYRLCCDLGYQVDVISTRQIDEGRLSDYRILIAPANDCYGSLEHPDTEAALTIRHMGNIFGSIRGPDLYAECIDCA